MLATLSRILIRTELGTAVSRRGIPKRRELSTRISRDDNSEIFGLKVLVENSSNGDTIDILAVHGRGAHPDHTWSHLRKADLDVNDSRSYINWLSDPTMLPNVLPKARIMRYGYNSAWFGEDKTITSPRIISQRLLIQLRNIRTEDPLRPLIIVAHSFGGLVVLQTLLDAHEDKKKWAGIYDSTTGLIFFGTPFRGSDELTQQTILRLAEQELGKDQVLEKALRTSQTGDESLVGLVDRYLRVSGQNIKPRVACFFEQKPTNVAAIVSKKQTPHMAVWVNESSGTLDVSESVEKFSRPCHHFNINKFWSPEQEDFLTLAGVFKTMTEESPVIIESRSQEPRKYYEVPNKLVSRFIGREETLSQIESYFSATNITRPRVLILHALGGQGKSQIALEYCRRSRDSHQGIFWINASSEATTIEAFETIATVLKFENSEQKIKDVLDTLEQWRTCWILVFDNYDWPGTFKSLKDFFPTAGNGKIIITSRNQDLGRFGKEIEVPAMNYDEGLELLLREPTTLQKNKDEGRRIVERLGGLPLAIDQAAAYIQYRRIKIEDFIPIYEETTKNILDYTPEFGWEYSTIQVHGREEEAKAMSAFTTWEMSFRQLIPNDPCGHKSAAHFLTLSAFLDHLNVAEDLFQIFWEAETSPPEWLKIFAQPTEDDSETGDSFKDDSFSKERVYSSDEQFKRLLTANDAIQRGSESHRQDTGTKGIWKSEMFHDLRAKCLQLSLLHVQSDDDQPDRRSQVYFLHPVIRDWLQLRVKKNKRRDYCQEAFNIVSVSIKSFASKSTVADQDKTLLDHMDACLLNDKRFSEDRRTIGYHRGDVASIFGRMYWAHSRWFNAEELFTQVVETKKEYLGYGHPDTLASIIDLAITYEKQGRWKEAEALQIYVIETQTKALVKDYPSILTSIGNLALLYRNQGQWEKAEKCYVQIVETSKRILGHEHPNTLSMISNLASIYWDQGRWKEAEELDIQIMETSERVLGLEHPDTLGMVADLALTWKFQNRNSEAIRLMALCADLQVKVLGDEHPDTKTSFRRLDAWRTCSHARTFERSGKAL